MRSRTIKENDSYEKDDFQPYRSHDAAWLSE